MRELRKISEKALTKPLLSLETGVGIAYVAALRARVPVLLHDRSEIQIKKGLAFMDKLLEKDTAKVPSVSTYVVVGD